MSHESLVSRTSCYSVQHANNTYFVVPSVTTTGQGLASTQYVFQQDKIGETACQVAVSELRQSVDITSSIKTAPMS